MFIIRDEFCLSDKEAFPEKFRKFEILPGKISLGEKFSKNPGPRFRRACGREEKIFWKIFLKNFLSMTQSGYADSRMSRTRKKIWKKNFSKKKIPENSPGTPKKYRQHFLGPPGNFKKWVHLCKLENCNFQICKGGLIFEDFWVSKNQKVRPPLQIWKKIYFFKFAKVASLFDFLVKKCS